MKTEDLEELVEDFQVFVNVHRDVLNDDERIRRPLLDAVHAARIKLEDRTKEKS